MRIQLIIEKVRNTLNRNPVLSTLILSGLIGFYFGLFRATWQVTVETGQVLAGIVKYPVDNPNYMYHIKTFTIVNQFSALLLHLIDSEKIASIVISGLLGMVSFQALSMLIFAINRDIYVSVLGALFIYFMNYVGVGVRYPILLLGFAHTYGVLGLSFIVLTIALIGAKAYRLGLFCLGLTLCVHPSWGSWLFIIIFFSALFQLGFAKEVTRRYYWYFIAGLFISVSSLVYQLYLIEGLPVIGSEIIKNQYLHSFIKYWDYHRQKFYYDPEIQKLCFAQRGIVLCVFSIMVSSLGLIYFKRKDSLAFVFRIIIISGILSLLVAIFTHFPPEHIPAYVLIFMPGRYINLNNIVLTALVLGILTYGDIKHYKLNYYIFLSLLILPVAFFPHHNYVKLQVLNSSIVLIWFTHIILKRQENHSNFRNAYLGIFKRFHFPIGKGNSLLAKRNRASYAKTFLCIMVGFLLINFSRKDFVNNYFTYRTGFKDRTNDPCYSIISERNGMMVTTADFFMISLLTRRPILINLASLDGFCMVPESGEALNNILGKIYGINILNAPPEKKYYNLGIVPPDSHRELWEKRTIEEWQDIRKEFGVTDVLTNTDWKLLLPVIVKDSRMVLYEIPERYSESYKSHIT